ncbi:hypothetical protein R0K18_29760, partial [Pantoea sp. SIMBA_133]
MDIDVDQEWLRKVLDTLQKADDTAPVVRWIERFADVCKELGKYQERLNDEYLERWEQASKLGEDNDAERKRLEDEAQLL